MLRAGTIIFTILFVNQMETSSNGHYLNKVTAFQHTINAGGAIEQGEAYVETCVQSVDHVGWLRWVCHMLLKMIQGDLV